MLKSTVVLCLLVTAGLYAQDRVDVTPSAPTVRDSLHFSLFNFNNCCCTRYYYNSIMIQDTTIFLSYEVDLDSCAFCYCFAAGSTTDFSCGPIPAGKYAIYKIQNMYCAPGEICPYGIAAPERVGEITVTGPSGNDTVFVQPSVPTDRDSLTLTLVFPSRHCCITRYYDKTLSVSDTIITLSYQASDSNCELVNCPMTGQTSFASGPLPAGTYAVYMAETPYCPGPICPLMIIYERVGQVTVTRSVSAERCPRPGAGGLQASPNPFNASVVISASGAERISVYSSDGRLVKSLMCAGAEKTVWNAKGLPAGVYVLKTQINGLMLTKKLLLAR